MGIKNTKYIIVRHHNTDKAKYYIYDAIKTVLPNCKTPADLRFGLKEFRIELVYKFKLTLEQMKILQGGGHVFLEKMVKKYLLICSLMTK